MAQRPVFVPFRRAPFVDVYPVEFEWNGGLSVSQKQKNVAALHRAFARRFPQRRVLEISSKSLQPEGVALSAFNLTLAVPALERQVPVECVYQGGKVFAAGGPYTDLYTASPKDAKRDPRLKSSGALRSFFFDGQTIPARPETAFYNWLYIRALLEHEELAACLMEYDGFTDIAFNPNKGISCQAQAAAVYVSLARKGLLEQCRSFDGFHRLLAAA